MWHMRCIRCERVAPWPCILRSSIDREALRLPSQWPHINRCGLSTCANMRSVTHDRTWKPQHGITFGDASTVRSDKTRSTQSSKIRNLSGAFRRQLHISKKNDAAEELSPEERADISQTTKESQHDENTSTLSFQIPDEVLQEAIKSQTSDEGRIFWSYGLYTDLHKRKVTVHYCRKIEASERIAQLFLNEKVVGLDLEWNVALWGRTSIKDRVSLIQLACEDRIALFHIALHRGTTIEEIMPPTLKRIIESPDITKAGVAILADCSRLKKHYAIDAQSLFELSHLHKLVKHFEQGSIKADRRLVSLAAQVQEHLYLPLAKDSEVRAGEWGKELDMTRITYAASDAYASVRLYHVLDQKRRSLIPTPPMPYHAERRLPIRLIEGESSEESLLISDDEEDEEEENDGQESSNDIISEGSYDMEDQSVTSSDRSASTSDKDQSSDSIPSQRQDRRKPRIQPSTEEGAPPQVDPPEILLANAWVEEFKAQNPSTARKVSSGRLRAFALWHQQAMDVPDIAALLRTPPLKNSTVAQYILDSIRLGKLPYDPVRMEAVLNNVPKLVARTRYSKFLSN